MTQESRRLFLQQIAGAAITYPTISAFGQDAAPSKPRIKIGQIGVGHAHASKLSVYRKSPDYEVVGIVEPNAERRAAAVQQAAFKGLPWMTRDELLNTQGLQAVLVETEVKDLLDNAEACVNAGMHIHLDKPAGESLPQFQRIQAAAAKQKLIIQLGYMFRYNPGVVLLRDLLTQGWLGEVFEVHAVMSKVIDPRTRIELAAYPGGILFELGGHVMDLVIGVLGSPDQVTGFNRHTSPLNDGLVDNMLAVLEYPKATATVRSSAVEVEGFARRQLTVCGTEGTLHIQPLDNPSARLALSQPRGDFSAGYQDIALPKYVRYVNDAADMAECIRGEKEFPFTPAHDVAVQKSLLTACDLALDK